MDYRFIELFLLAVIAVGVWSLKEPLISLKSALTIRPVDDIDTKLDSLIIEVRKIKFRVSSLAKDYNESEEEELLREDEYQ